ncbi:hypothetical protein hmeg3_21160 [Herbaspirillum sp. meg3]|uniref:hypothetical protein n=1 Tax=Herbaspirillum sp. meg3 TaxID=2025949 RepID=UPI000B99347F|nr:hypothetical protein [Herbaspirillum sp. meg3]ASU40561.1 hypothetical protein hmeg3_21160 [Herbaspirillum sp. meg3]
MSHQHKQSIIFVLSNLGGKSVAALAQLYAIFIFSKIHTPIEASVIFLLLGYAIWFQVLELGLSQTLQNRFNARKSAAADVRLMIVIHYVFVLVLAACVIASPLLPRLLLPAEHYDAKGIEFRAFSIGMALMIIATSNVILQRMLVVLNKGLTANTLLILQALTSLVGLALYAHTDNPNIVISVLLYLAPQVLINLPLIINVARKVHYKRTQRRKDQFRAICTDALGFWTLNVLSAVFLGADYYFSAHYLSSEQIVSYHFATRFFFLSFVVYYAFVQHQSRRLTPAALRDGAPAMRKMMRNSAIIGVASVTLIYLSVIALDDLHLFEHLTNKNVIDHSLMLAAFFYFTIRVLRDVGLVTLSSAGIKSVLYKVYVVEVVLGFTLLTLTAQRFNGVGILVSMGVTCLVSTLILFYLIKKLITAHTQNQVPGTM